LVTLRISAIGTRGRAGAGTELHNQPLPGLQRRSDRVRAGADVILPGDASGDRSPRQCFPEKSVGRAVV